MRSYCSCGSLIVYGKCTNKNCETLAFGLDVFDLQRQINMYCNNEKIAKKLKKFDGFLPMIPKYDSLLTPLNDDDSYDTKINLYTEFKELKAFGIPLNMSVCVNVSDNLEDRLAFIKLRESSIKESRGKLDKITPYILKMELYYPYANNGYIVYFGSYNQSSWQIISKFKPRNIEDELGHIEKAIGLQYTLSKNWSVYVKDANDVIGMRMMIGRKKAKEIFKLREIEDGKQRRTALKHIVNSYTRNTNTDNEISVLEHLRGATEFKWEGLKCVLIPSMKEQRNIEKLKSNKRQENKSKK